MSVRLRLTLLYSAILALTLVVLGTALYAAVSQVSMGATGDALSAEAHSIAISLQPHLGPDQPGGVPGSHGQGQPPGTSGVAPQPTHLPGAGGNPPAQDGLPGNLGNFMPPPDVAMQSTLQVRSPSGKVIYASADLKAANVTLPLSTASLLRMASHPGASQQSIVLLGNQRLLVLTMALGTHGTTIAVLQVARSLRDLDETLSTLRIISLTGGGIAVLIAFGVGWWLAGAALRPIKRITQTAHDIGAAQDFGRRVSYDGPPDEIGRLASTFNTMLSRLQAAFHTQRRFVADASHELRTPLTSIRGNLGLLQREPPIGEADRVAVLNDLVSESERLSRLVADLLTLARSDTGRELRQEPVPLSPLVSDVIRRLAVLHPDRIVHEDPHPDLTALGDPDALTQVLVILLDNALKFTPVEGTVTVTTSKHGHLVAVTVRDTGPGIATEALPHVFERFYQEDSARAGSGSGLGLAIAKALIDGQGGSIAVESKVGAGSAFTVTLPDSQRVLLH